MSFCTRGTCPDGKDVFVWLPDGPYLGDETDPDFGSYPWVHAAPVGPGMLEVCRSMPFATAEECGEVCACGCPTTDHKIPTGPIPFGVYRPWPCRCGCPDFRHKPEHIARWRASEGHREAAWATAARAPAPAVVTPAQEPANEQLGLFGDETARGAA